MRVIRHLLLPAMVVALIAWPQARAQSATGATRNVETGFIWSQSEAEEKCPRVAAEAHGRWTGQWRMSVPGQTSFCEVADIVEPRAEASRDVEAGPIWGQADAEEKCRRVAAEVQGRWTGQWRTVEPGRSSVCEISDSVQAPVAGARYIEAGPIWNQADAETKCAVVAAAVRGRWAGQWATTEPGRMSVCGIVDMPPSRPRRVDAGPIWNQEDAQQKCPVAAIAVHGRWTGQWVTTREGRMSVCEIVD